MEIQFGDYRLVRLLGEGGFAEVYEADHVHLPTVKAAIKLLKGSFTPQQIEDLRREALVVGKLDHPHIVQLRTFSIERGLPYLVMAYAQGGALNRRHPRGTRLALPEILAYVRPVAAALQYAHEQKTVHRDLKPANLLLAQDGRVQVADFGIAVMAHSSRSRTIQEIAGTWVYMAPEQFRGLAEPASDQYALAIMVYQWLCGNVPFDGNGNMYLIPQQQKEEAPPSLRAKLPDLLPGVEDVVMKALAKNPKERFASIQAFAEALEEASRPPFMPAPGQRLGDYRLVRKLGEGGFAEVYEAEHLFLGTRAAIKLLKGTFTPAQVEGLRQEARAVIQLDHQHIIRAYGFSIERKTPYLIMAYAPGGSLATRHEQGTPLPLETIRAYVRQIAAALQYAHDQKITHRDIKPENILLAQDGRLQVADFGIAIMAQTTQATQEIVGSWTYMAPEQFTGQAEPASDQYALGIMVYEWLCGEPPFTGNGSIYALPYQHMNEPPPSLCQRIPPISSRIEQVVMKALAKQPGERFASVPAFAQALEAACTTPPIGTTLLTYEHLGGQANVVAWSPDGTRGASGGDDATVRIWDVATGQTLLTRRGHSAPVTAIAWSPDGRLLASASYDHTVQVWEASTGKVLLTYRGHFTLVRDVAWSPDGEQIASAGYEVRVWVAPH
jgi:serine/threonine protein kinase